MASSRATSRADRSWPAGGLLFGLGMVAQAARSSFLPFSLANIVSRIGGSPQHPVGNGLLAEQFPPERRGFAISAHISGGNVGTVVAALAGPLILASVGWRGASILFGMPAALIGLAMFRWIRETGSDRAAAIRQGNVREAARLIAARLDDPPDLPRVDLRRRGTRPRRREPVRPDLPDRGRSAWTRARPT